jgi:hypothetical protein
VIFWLLFSCSAAGGASSDARSDPRPQLRIGGRREPGRGGAVLQVPQAPAAARVPRSPGADPTKKLQILVYKYWFTNIGLQILVYKYWFTNIGLQILVYKYWFTNICNKRILHFCLQVVFSRLNCAKKPPE